MSERSRSSDAHTEQPSLEGRRAVVTGGTTGIGRAIAVLLASEGVRVFVCGRTPEHLDDALERIREVGEGDGITVDLSRRDDVDRFFKTADAYLGQGNYAKAIELYKLALQKGPANADQANMHLGIAQAMSGDKASAQTSFAAVQNEPAKDIASLWQAYAGGVGAAASVSPPAAGTSCPEAPLGAWSSIASRRCAWSLP